MLANPKISVRAKLEAGRKTLKFHFRTILNLRVMQKPSVPKFAGWGMETHHALPWETINSSDSVGFDFYQADLKLAKLIHTGNFVLSQFNNFGKIPPQDYCDRHLSRLRFRHFVVFWSAKFAARSKTSSRLTFVEAGTCDGLTVYFADAALRSESIPVEDTEIYLYDSWGPMKSEYLKDSESHKAGSYSYLSLDQTKQNLAACDNSFQFMKGYIPEVFNNSDRPDVIDWLHIDLNSAIPTQDTLDFFMPKLRSGGLVLFDDYGHDGYGETKKIVDQYFRANQGILFPMPTGQAMFFKLA
jgi:hypothetical protein